MNAQNAHEYLPLVYALANGKQIQHKNEHGEWVDVETIVCVAPQKLRIKNASNLLTRESMTIREQEEAAGLLDKANIALRVKWVNALRAIVGSTMPKNKSGVSLVSDIDLILASDEQRLMALEKIK